MAHHDTSLTIDEKRAQLAEIKRVPIATLLPPLGWRQDAKDKMCFRDDTRKIGIFTASSGDWMWKNHITGDRGTVIDLACEKSGSIDAARKLLLSLTTTPASSAHIPSSICQKLVLSGEEIAERYIAASSPWLPCNTPPDALFARGVQFIYPRHRGTFRFTGTGSIRIPFFSVDESGQTEIAGYETRQPCTGFKSYLKGGRVGIWIGGSTEKSRRMVVCESMIDCFASDILRGKDHPHLVAVRSGGEQYAVNYIKHLHAAGVLDRVDISTDNDAAGLAYASKIMLLLKDVTRLTTKYMAPGLNAVDIADELALRLTDDLIKRMTNGRTKLAKCSES